MNWIASEAAWGLGLDAGGTATRWQLVDGHGHERARGEVAGWSATQFGTLQQPLLGSRAKPCAACGGAKTRCPGPGNRALGLAPPLSA